MKVDVQCCHTVCNDGIYNTYTQTCIVMATKNEILVALSLSLSLSLPLSLSLSLSTSKKGMFTLTIITVLTTFNNTC